MGHKGQFKKGHKPLGRSLSGHVTTQETKDRISKKAIERFRSGAVPHNKGKKHDEKTRKKMSLNHADVSGKNNPMYGEQRVQPKGKNSPSYKNGIGGYRKRAIKKYGFKCCECGIDNKDLLLVHHVDKNRKNNEIENLEVPCRNCHWLKHKDDK